MPFRTLPRPEEGVDDDDPIVVVTAPDLPWPSGFTTRSGGTSTGPYAGLNLGLSSGDDETAVEANRDRLLARLGFERSDVCAFHQVHGNRILPGDASWFEEHADAATTDVRGRLLVVSVADCLPVLFYDPVQGAIGAAHCGWRGTVAGLAGDVVRTMASRFGTQPGDLHVAIGPGIQGPCYQVGDEVVTAFLEAGFPASVAKPDDQRRHRLDLVAANRWALEAAGVMAERIWSAGLCTHCEPTLFSHRGDAGRTGRHWAFIALPT